MSDIFALEDKVEVLFVESFVFEAFELSDDFFEFLDFEGVLYCDLFAESVQFADVQVLFWGHLHAETNYL